MSGARLGVGGNAARRVNWVARTGSVVLTGDVTSDPQSFTFSLPSTETTLIMDEGGGTVTVDNRGVWKVYISDAAEAAFRTGATFTVTAPTPYVDLQVSQSATTSGSAVGAGSSSVFEIFLTNAGPNAAANVKVSDTVPANTTFVSLTESTGLGFACSGTAGALGVPGCTLASMPAGSRARIVLAYSVEAGTAAGTVLTNTVSATSATAELEPGDNSSSFDSAVPTTAGAQTCTLTCREDMTVPADATQGGQPGAVVNFGAANGTGTCGAINASPASGTFFPVGSTVVSVSSETGGGSCSFVVTVIGSTAPTISCPADQAASAGPDGTAEVNPGTPTTTPSTGVEVEGVRSDGQSLGAPYPTGETVITWTVTDTAGRTATCTQKITVTGAGCPGDTAPPTIQAPANVTVMTGAADASCSLVLSESALGQATASDDCAGPVTLGRSGVPEGHVFPVGTTTITYTAIDSSGNHATPVTQTVTVVDNTKPVIAAPADAAYVCPSDVPAAHPSQATRGTVLDEDGQPLPPGPPFDNCGVPVVTVAETSTGAGSVADPLIITRTFKATDAVGNFSTAVQTITVVDPTAPTISAPADLTLQCASGIPTASPSQATAADNCAAPTVTVSDSSNNGAGSAASPLVITRTYTATDAAGNTASDSQTITVIDTTAPTVSAPADLTLQCASGIPAPDASQATASDNCAGTPAVTVSDASNNGAGSAASPLVITRTFTATDAAGNTASDTQTITVSDTTAPTLDVPTDITVGNDAGSCSAGVSFAVTATDNCGPANVALSHASGSVFQKGTTTVTATATDAAGNATTKSFTVTVNDTEAPTISYPAGGVTVSLPMNSPATSMPVSFAVTAADNCGVQSLNVSPASGPPSGSVYSSVFSVGTTTVTATATDASGNTTVKTFTVTVLYNFAGFFSPVANLPTFNSVNAGRAIPVKFSLSGNKGLSIFAAGSPASQPINCSSTAPTSELEGTVTSGGSSLSYDAGSDQYHYNWKTEGSWAGTCRALVVTLNDGSAHTAYFKFK
ncbi:MAG: PxKF domain-containing protein [Acidobacteria bacterium]|nr:PxKF domain-containing protein [Acidobacteriota bacterium]MCA1620356.1 PxKF domain-containing protein [Acidobacteriota bacterium]